MPQERSDHHFDRFAQNYDQNLQRGLQITGESKQFYAAGRVRWVQRQLHLLGVHPQRILDYGCGTGSSIRLLLALDGTSRVTGVDVSVSSLATAVRDHSDLQQVDFSTPERLPPLGQFDLVFCNGVFHHIAPPQRAAAMDYIAGSLKSGGFAALWENNPWNPGTRWVMRRIPFDRDAQMLFPSALRRLASAAGLKVLRTRFAFICPRTLRFLRPSERLLSSLPLGGQYVALCCKPP